MKIYHHNDLDGRCAAAIALKRHPDAECIEVDYKDPINIAEIDVYEPIVIVDFSFKPEVMDAVLKLTDDVTWIDHHRTAADYDYGRTLPGLRDFADKKHSGCELAWLHYCSGKQMPLAVELIGDYDKWAHKMAPASLEFVEGMKLRPHDPRDQVWAVLLKCDELAQDGVDTIMNEGQAAIRYRDHYCADIRKGYGYETEIGGHKAYAMNCYRFGSQGFGAHIQAEYPIMIACIHDGAKWTVSLYTERPDLDVSAIAKEHGGGGHKGAAGFVCEELPFVRRQG